jgi:hypothetical protein
MTPHEDGRDARPGDHERGVAVPRVGRGRAATFYGPHPLLQLDGVGRLEPVQPIAVDLLGEAPVQTHRGARWGRGVGGAAHADHLDADLVAEPRVHVDLYRRQAPVSKGELYQLQVELALRRPRRVQAADKGFLDLRLEHPAGRVEVVDGRVDDHPLGVRAGRYPLVPVPPLEEHRLPDGARGGHPLDVHVLRVVAAHKADLHELPAQLDLGLDDPERLLRTRGERLLAQDGLAEPQALVHQLGVRGVGGGDDDGLDPLVPDHLERVPENRSPPALLRDLPGPVGVHVGDGRHPRPRDLPVQAMGVHPTHAAGTHDAYRDPLVPPGSPAVLHSYPLLFGVPARRNRHRVAPSRACCASLFCQSAFMRPYLSATEETSSSSSITPASQRRPGSP